MALSGALLAPATAFPAPFNLVSTSIKVAPVIIYAGAAGAGGDVIVTMAGNAGLGEAPISFPDTPTAAAVNLSNHAGVRANDILLLTDISPPSVAGVVDITAVGVAPCLMEQVDSTFIPIAGDNKIVPLAGKYYLATIDGHSATDYTSDSSSKQVINLGASPNLNMYAVGPNNTLMKYDLMQNLQSNSTLANANPGIYVDGVYQMKALYGVGPAPLTWFAPTGAFSAASLLTGTAAAKKNLKSIKAIKVGVVMRTSLLERETVNASSLILFSDTGLPVTVDLSPTTFRYRSFEAVIPLRNPLMLK
jgi:type IV pilus assembly protein PilW